MAEFRVGDRVICRHPDSKEAQSVATVTLIYGSGGAHSVHVRWDDSSIHSLVDVDMSYGPNELVRYIPDLSDPRVVEEWLNA